MPKPSTVLVPEWAATTGLLCMVVVGLALVISTCLFVGHLYNLLWTAANRDIGTRLVWQPAPPCPALSPSYRFESGLDMGGHGN